MTETAFRKKRAQATKEFSFFAVFGCSWAGRTTWRKGQWVSCGHRHKTRKGTEPCLRRMRRDRPGNCQDYRVGKLTCLVVRKGSQAACNRSVSSAMRASFTGATRS